LKKDLVLKEKRIYESRDDAAMLEKLFQGQIIDRDGRYLRE